jgi:zinc protease
LDEIGADEGAGTDFSLKVLAEHFDRGTQLLADNELNPGLPEEAFTVVRKQVADTVAGRLKSPDYLSSRAVRAALFPKDDPTLRQPLPETVNALTLDDVRQYYKTVFRPDMTTIVVIGKVTPEKAAEVIGKYFGSWTATGPKPNVDLPAVPPNPPGVTAVPDLSRVQDRVTLGQTVPLTRKDPDFYAMRLGNNVLGGAFYSTRLTRDLRKNAGLVYAVDSYLDAGKTRAIYFVQYACDPQNVSKVQNIIAREFQTMQTTPVTADEFQRAKALLIRRIPLAEASVGDIAYGLIERARLDLPLDEPTLAAKRYLELTTADVQAAFAKYVRPEDFARVSQGPTPQ